MKESNTEVYIVGHIVLDIPLGMHLVALGVMVATVGSSIGGYIVGHTEQDNQEGMIEVASMEASQLVQWIEQPYEHFAKQHNIQDCMQEHSLGSIDDHMTGVVGE